ncbi:MAG: histidine kinase, partial [Bacteroidia bacterium]|nr:histidine kinase [Bacteroidia bacterium]
MRKSFFYNFFFFLAVFLSPLKTWSQSYSFTTYGVEDGLPYIQIYALFQDSKGYMWSGGYGGLSSFDGQDFVVYNPKDGLSNHWVTSITEDKSGKLWIGTIDGLSVLKDKKFTNYFVSSNLCGNYVNIVFKDRNGKIWIGTEKGINFSENDSIKKVAASLGFNVKSLSMDTDGNLWAGTTKGVLKFSSDGKLIATLNSSNGLPTDNVTVIRQDAQGKILVGTTNGLVIMNNDFSGIKIFSVTTGLFDPSVTSILVDFKNNVWIGTPTGLVKFNGNKFSYLQLNDEINSNKISTLQLDYEQNIWIGTFNGLFKFRGEGLVNYGPADGLKHPFIYEISGDKDWNKWVCTESGGVYFYDGINFKNYGLREGLPGVKVTTALDLKDGRTLFGTDAGYSVLTKNRFENYSVETGFNLTAVNTFFKDSKGRIWAGGKNGLAYFTEKGDKTKKFDYTYFTLPTDIEEYDVWSFTEDGNGNIWIGTYLAGLYEYDGKEIKKFIPAGDKKSTSFLEMAVVNGKHFFGATLEGVYYMNLETGKAKYITEEDGMNSDLTYSLMVTRDKKTLWSGTNQGVNKINLEEFLTTGKVDLVAFGKTEGLRGVECNSHGFFEDRNGEVWIGTVNGLSKFNPEEYIPNVVKSKLNLTNLKLFYNDTILADNSELPYYLNNISFKYIGICLTNPAKVKYVCKLEGFDQSWSPETSDNFKTYSNLPPGKYTFKVKSCNSEGIWNENLIAITFTILSPWYTSWWFTLAVVAFFIAVIMVIFRIRLNQEKKRQKAELQTQIEISKNELKALRAQINPHFIFNSLNSIQHFIIERDNTEAARYLNKFAKLFRMILNNSEKSTVSIREEVDMLAIYLELETMRFQNKFDYEFIIDEKIDPDYEEMPTMLLQPYIENAILHG